LKVMSSVKCSRKDPELMVQMKVELFNMNPLENISNILLLFYRISSRLFCNRK
jgi:hypothetical protein